MSTFPCLVRFVPGSGQVRYRLGDRLVDRYLKFVAGRCRPNTLRAVAFDLKAFFTVIPKDPVAGLGSGDWLIGRPGPRYRISVWGGRRRSRAPAARPFAGWRSSSPLQSGGAGTTGTGAVRGRTRRPTSPLPPMDGISRAGGGARRGCRTRCGQVAWALMIWCGTIPAHCGLPDGLAGLAECVSGPRPPAAASRCSRRQRPAGRSCPGRSR